MRGDLPNPDVIRAAAESTRSARDICAYNDLEEALRTAPATWVPGLLRALLCRGLEETFRGPAAVYAFIQHELRREDD